MLVVKMAYPRRTLDLLQRINKEYSCCFVRGNKGDYWLDYAYSRTQEWRYGSSTMDALLYTYSRCDAADASRKSSAPWNDAEKGNGALL